MFEKSNVNESSHETVVDEFNRVYLREVIGVLKKLEVDKVALANRSDFSIEAAFELFAESSLE